MNRWYRHWDTALIIRDVLPEWLDKSKEKVFLHWKNNDHYIDNWDLYLYKDPNNLWEDEFDYWYLVAKDTTLYHTEHWVWEDGKRTAKIEDWIYQIYKQKEFTADWFKIIVD